MLLFNADCDDDDDDGNDDKRKYKLDKMYAIPHLNLLFQTIFFIYFLLGINSNWRNRTHYHHQYYLPSAVFIFP